MPTDLDHLPMLIDAAEPASAPSLPVSVQLADWLLRSPSSAPWVAAYRRCTAELLVGAAGTADRLEPPWWQELGTGWAAKMWLEHHDPTTA